MAPLPDAEPGPAELDVLKVLWDEGPGTVRKVMNALHQRGRSVAYTTVQTFLTRLEQKGYVRSDRSDFAFVFRASVTRRRVTRSRLRGVLDSLFDGAAGPLVLQLMKEEKFSADEIAELQKRIDQMDPERGTPPRAGDG
ncbi:MAG: BlaI/MecI/CopY family transcriptional regulator [Planctomycetota bacterium]